MNVDDLKEMIDLVKDLSDLDENNLSCLETYNLVMRARELTKKSSLFRQKSEVVYTTECAQIEPKTIFSEYEYNLNDEPLTGNEFNILLKEQQERFFKKWGTA